MKSACPSCGAPVGWFALACRRCGARNEKLRELAEGSALIVVLVAAIGAAAFIATRHRPPAGGRVQSPAVVATAPPAAPAAPAVAAPAPPVAMPAPPDVAPVIPPTSPDEDFALLEQAMAACDDQAARNKDKLYFLVVPLVVQAGDPKDWQAISLTRIGNAIVLPSKDTIAGLRRKSLTISKEQYVFSLRDTADGVVRGGEPAGGIRLFTFPQAAGIRSFNVRFKSGQAGRDSDWGNPMIHKPGTCYWVTVLPQP